MTGTGGEDFFRGDLPLEVVIPDDARDLELDRLALERERAAARRQAKVSRVFLTRRWHRHGISGPIVSICLLVVFVFAALLALLVPRGVAHRRAALPLATTSVAPGLVGGLLPEASLRAVGLGASTAAVGSHDLRPGVILLIPATCEPDPGAACADTVRTLTSAAKDFGLSTWLVGGTELQGLPELADVPQSAGTFATPLVDDTGTVLRAFDLARTPTAVFVDATGVVRAVLPGATRDTEATPVLERLTGYA